MKLRLTISMATLVAFLSLSAMADEINDASNDQSVSDTSEASKKTVQTTSSDVKEKVTISKTTKAHIEIEGKIPTEKKANVVLETTTTEPISGTTTIEMPISGENNNREQNNTTKQNNSNGSGFNMPWGNYNNRGAYPIIPMTPMPPINPMRYAYPPSQNGYYNIVPMMAPQQMIPPQQMFPTLSYEQQQAQMDRIRLQFEAMAKRIANAQKALAQAHHKAQMQSQAPLTTPITAEDISKKK